MSSASRLTEQTLRDAGLPPSSGAAVEAREEALFERLTQLQALLGQVDEAMEDGSTSDRSEIRTPSLPILQREVPSTN